MTDSAPPVNPVQAAWLALKDAVNADYAEREASSDDRGKRAIRIAKYLYTTKHDRPGDDPVMSVNSPAADGKGFAIHGPFVPAWATYLRDALTMIDIMEAVDKT